MSARTAFLLLATIVQAALGYAFLGPAATSAALRDTHLLLGLSLIALAVHAWRALAPIMPLTARLRMMRWAVGIYVVTGPLQMLSGALLRWTNLATDWPLLMLHLGAGLALPFLALAAHMGAVQPSLRLGAEREHGRALRAFRQAQSPKTRR